MHALHAPYRTLSVVPCLDAHPPRGTILALPIRPPLTEGQSACLADLIRSLRRYLPFVPVVLAFPCLEDDDAISIALRMRLVGARGALAIGSGRVDARNLRLLRHQLTDVTVLADDVILWLGQRDSRWTGPVRNALRAIIGAGTRRVWIEELASACGESAETWRSRFQRRGLGTPGAWLCMVRALRGVLWLQRHPDSGVAAAAYEHDFHDASTFSRACVRAFRQRPPELRELLGWEVLVTSWLDRVADPPSEGADHADA